MKCTACGGVWHEATGHVWSRRVRVCGPCIRLFIRWLRNRPGPSGGKSKPRKSGK